MADLINDVEASRYELRVDDDVAAFADYILSNGLITFSHTETLPEFERQGMASKLVRGALDDVREKGERKVVPLCPFVKGWMANHPEYMDLHY